MKETEINPTQKVIRSLVVSLTTPEDIYEDFFIKKQLDFSCLRFYIGIKGENKENCRYTFLGGRINLYENPSEAIQREIVEEVGLTPLGIPYQTKIGRWQYFSKKSGEREVILTYNPVLPSKILSIGDPKIIGIKVLNLSQLKELIETGELDGIPIEGHLGLNSKDQIDISEEEANKRNQAMKKLLSWMDRIENYLRKKIKQTIFQKGDPISLNEFNNQYQLILSEFIAKGIKVANKEKKPYAEEKRDELIKALDDGFLGKDILYYLPQIAKYGLNWVGLEKATEGVKIFVNFLKQVFNNFINELNLTEQEFRNLINDENKTLEEKISLINAFNIFFRNQLKLTFNLEENDLNMAAHHIQDFFRELSNEMKIADPKLTQGLYQDFTLINEVNNANFGYLLLLFLEYDTKINNQKAQEIIRFEAGRQLFLLFKTLSGIKYYNNESEKIKNGKLQSAISAFFGPVVDEKIIDLDKNNKIRVRIRKRGNQFFIIDEKPTKTFTSFLRKSLEEKIKDIKDFYSVSIVFTEPANQQNVDQLIRNLSEFITNQFPKFELEIDDKKTYGTENFFHQTSLEASGKRKGSQSKRLVRTKLFFILKDKKHRLESLELTIYPYFSITDDFFWGWLEKIQDDKNYVARRLFSGENGFPSLYDLLFPPELYPHHYSQKITSSYHQS